MWEIFKKVSLIDRSVLICVNTIAMFFIVASHARVFFTVWPSEKPFSWKSVIIKLSIVNRSIDQDNFTLSLVLPIVEWSLTLDTAWFSHHYTPSHPGGFLLLHHVSDLDTKIPRICSHRFARKLLSRERGHFLWNPTDIKTFGFSIPRKCFHLWWWSYRLFLVCH